MNNIYVYRAKTKHGIRFPHSI